MWDCSVPIDWGEEEWQICAHYISGQVRRIFGRVSSLHGIIRYLEKNGLTSADLARKMVEAASERQANDIVMLDMRGVCDFTDFFVICSAESDRQINAIREEISKVAELVGARMRSSEGTADSGWVLLDYFDVIAHVFSTVQREFYRLEELWQNAATVLRVQ